jgi:hypothetical protein
VWGRIVAYKVLVGRRDGKNHLEELGGRCEDNIKMVLQKVGC